MTCSTALALLLNVLQCPIVPLLLTPCLVSLLSGKALGLNCRVGTWQWVFSKIERTGQEMNMPRPFLFRPLRSRLEWPLCHPLSCARLTTTAPPWPRLCCKHTLVPLNQAVVGPTTQMPAQF